MHDTHARMHAHTRTFEDAWRACARARRAYLQYMQINMPCEGTGCKERTGGEEGSTDLPAGCNNRPSVVAMVTPSIP